jgi:hypothetical protein
MNRLLRRLDVMVTFLAQAHQLSGPAEAGH